MTAAADARDDYPGHRFRLAWNGRTVAGFTMAGPLPSPGSDPPSGHRMPGQNACPPITLERGVTRDADFAQWASTIRYYHNSDAGDGTAASTSDLGRDLTLDLFDAAGS